MRGCHDVHRRGGEDRQKHTLPLWNLYVSRRNVRFPFGTCRFPRAAPVRIASLGALDIWVTDSDPPPALRTRCEVTATEIRVAPPAE